MAFNQTEKQEKEYLKQIISFLKKVIGNTDASVKDHVDTLAEYKDYIWSNKEHRPARDTLHARKHPEPFCLGGKCNQQA